TTPKELELFARIDKAAPKYDEFRAKAIKLGEQNENEEALKVFRDEAHPYLEECFTAGQELMSLNSQMGAELSTELTTQSRISMIVIVAVMIASAAIAITLALIVSGSISKPVKACAKRLEELSNGDLHTEVPTSDSKDETGIMLNSLKFVVDFLNTIIGEIGRALGEMADGNLDIDTDVEFTGDFEALKTSINRIVVSLNSALSQINVSSDQVSSGSDQVSSGAQALSQGATEQASSVEELAATITEISSQIKENAENAKNASLKTNEAGNEVTNSNQKMQELIAAMGEISSSSQEIGKVIKAIEDIAFQTNILALNAAVEAARAGAAGKGFAVVADEVRNLATKSSEAAKQTNVLIEGSVKAVENGVNIAHETSKSLAEVVSGAKQITDLIGQISAASAEQSTSIAQINLGVEQISSVVQTNSATSEESAAASEELNGQATMLRTLVSKFVLFSGGKGAVEKPKVAFTTEPSASYQDDFAGSKY
ncbi:MAG: methyl-accepting chemotaxis protein, partial [Oscillospiraceae bacterium]